MNIVLKVLKFVLEVIWTISLKNICVWAVLGWHWLWSKTSFDEKAIAVVKETARRANNVKEELEDVVDAAKGKKIKKIKDMSKLKMVMKDGQMVPFYAADGRGKMETGGPMQILRLQDEARRFAMQGKEMGSSDMRSMAKYGIESYQTKGETDGTPSYGVGPGDKVMTNQENMDARDPFKQVTPAESQRADNKRIIERRNPLG